MVLQMSLRRFAAAALVAGLATGAGMSAYTMANARLGDDLGVTDGSDSYLRYAGNENASALAIMPAAATRCADCRDSYDVVYLNDPERNRDDTWAASDGDYVLASADNWSPPAETGWGSDDSADQIDQAARLEASRQAVAESRQRMDAVRRQVERSVTETAAMVEPVKVHRGANAQVVTVQVTSQPVAPAPTAKVATAASN